MGSHGDPVQANDPSGRTRLPKDASVIEKCCTTGIGDGDPPALPK